MSITRSRGGLLFASKASAIIIDPETSEFLTGKKSASGTLAPEDQANGEIANWGDNNMLPIEMVKHLENTSVLNSAIETKARIAIGKGPVLCKIEGRSKDGQEELKFVSNPEIEDWMERSNFFEDSFSLCKDLLATGNPFDNLVLTRDRSQIYGFQRIDPTECRFSKMDKMTRKSEFVLLSSDWESHNKFDNLNSDPYIQKVPLLDKRYPLLDLQGRTKGESFMISMQYPLLGRKYYALPLWWPAREWVKMSQAIPEIKKAIMKNQMKINYMVEIHPEFWANHDPRYKNGSEKEKVEIKDKFYDAIEESLIGGENAYKSLFSTMIPGRNGETAQPGIKITTLQDKLKEGELLTDSAAADSNTYFAMMVNPSIIGVGQSGEGKMGAGSGANIRESYLSQVMTLELERRLLAKRFDLAKNYNGWDRTYTLRFPNQLMTTLNTGANSQPTA